MGRGPNIVSCGGDKTVRFHQGDNGNNFRNFGGATDFMFAAAASQNEQVVIAGGQDGVLRAWNGANGQVLRTFEPPKPPADNAQAQAK
jgi:WD40 repeat protein